MGWLLKVAFFGSKTRTKPVLPESVEEFFLSNDEFESCPDSPGARKLESDPDDTPSSRSSITQNVGSQLQRRDERWGRGTAMIVRRVGFHLRTFQFGG